MRYNIPIPSRVGFPAFKSRIDLLIFCSAFFTSSLFFSSGRFNTFSSPMLSGILKCNPPIISAPYCYKSRPRIPAPSPLNNPIVAIRKTFLFPQNSLFFFFITYRKSLHILINSLKHSVFIFS